MHSRRFVHQGKNRFFEVFWEDAQANVNAGVLGTDGRSRSIAFAEIEHAIQAKLREGYVEVMTRAEVDARAPNLEISQEWIARIGEAFDDDEPRRVLADWLQTQGDPRGDFIALQCESARLAPWHPKHSVLLDRERRLLVALGARWLPPRTTIHDLQFRRGFLERIRSDCDEPLDPLLELAPLIRTLEVSSRTLLRMRAATRLAAITGLYFQPSTARLALEPLLREADLAGVDRLGLTGQGFTGGELAPLATRSFRELELARNALGVRGVQHALASAMSLRMLDLNNAGIGTDGALLLAGVALPQLERLHVNQSGLADRWVAGMAKAQLPALRQLELGRNPLGGKGTLALFEGCSLPSLVWLDLTATDLDDRAVQALARSPLAAQLEYLDIEHNPKVSSYGAGALADTGMPALQKLVATGISNGAVEVFKKRLPHAQVVVDKRSRR